MLNDIAPKTVHKEEDGESYRKKKTLNQLKSVKYINKNPQSSLGISPLQMVVPPSHYLYEYAYEF